MPFREHGINGAHKADTNTMEDNNKDQGGNADSAIGTKMPVQRA